MKKISLIIIAICISTLSYAQGFESSKLRAGAGLAFASDINNIGLTLNAAYEFTDIWEGAFAFTHFFKKSYVSWSVFDFDAHYIFYTDGSRMNVYGIGGLSVTSVSVTIPAISYGGVVFSEETKVSDSNVGLNIGAGLNYKLSDQLNLSPELRFSISNGSYVRLGATVQYRF